MEQPKIAPVKKFTVIIDGQKVEAVRPPNTNTAKANDTALYTLSTKNALKLSNYVLSQLDAKEGDFIDYLKVGEKIVLYKPLEADEFAVKVTKLGSNNSYKRFNHTNLWYELKGSETETVKYELGEPVTFDGHENIKAFTLVFIERKNITKPTAKKKTSRSTTTAKQTSTGGNQTGDAVKQVIKIETDNVLNFELPLNN